MRGWSAVLTWMDLFLFVFKFPQNDLPRNQNWLRFQSLVLCLVVFREGQARRDNIVTVT